MNSRRFLAVPALVVAALVAQAGVAPPAHAATVRYASPTGTAAQSCIGQVNACSIDKAINSAALNDEVIVLPGTYNVGGTALANGQSGINVHGVVGQSRPVINSSAAIGLQLTGASLVKVSDLAINHSGDSFGLDVFSSSITVQHVEVHSTGPVACFFGVSGLVRDSFCATPADNGVALDDSWGGTSPDITAGTLTLRNITAIAPGKTSYGVRAEAGDFGNLDVNVRNVIALGTQADFRVTRTANNSDSDISVASSNYDTISSNSSGATITAAGTGTNQTAPPVFADAVVFHQALGSPTIDKGTTDASVGTTDIDGNARKIGTAVDIGADEYVPDTTPPVIAWDKHPKHRTTNHKVKFRFHASEAVTFVCTIDKRPPVFCASPYKARLKKGGKHTLVLQASDPTGNFAVPLTFKWKLKNKGKHHHRRHHHH